MTGCGDDFQASLLSEIADFCGDRGISEARFGNLAVNDAAVVNRLRAGRVTIRTANKLKHYLSVARRELGGAAHLSGC